MTISGWRDTEPRTLDPVECFRLLRTVAVGRIVFTERALPAIQPVPFTVDGSNVIIRASGEGKLAAAVRNTVVAFEADQVDPTTRCGWNVVILGYARLLRDTDRPTALNSPGSPPDDADRARQVIRIKAERITGRCLVPS